MLVRAMLSQFAHVHSAPQQPNQWGTIIIFTKGLRAVSLQVGTTLLSLRSEAANLLGEQAQQVDTAQGPERATQNQKGHLAEGGGEKEKEKEMKARRQ